MTDATLPRVRPAAALTVSLAVALYALLWVGWMHEQPWVIRPDNWALEVTYDAAQDHRWWVPLWHGLSLVFAPMLLRVLVLIPVILELRRHRTRVAIFLAVSVWGSGLVTTAAKFLADRNRPETQMVQAMNTSFPSGHALGVAVTVGALVAVYAHATHGARRVLAVSVGAAVVVAIGVARVALNVHHPSDIIAGWALAYVWLALCLWLIPPYPSPDQRGR